MPMRPPLALTMGEPAGIGPEITAKAWRLRDVQKVPPFFLIGRRAALDAHGCSLPVTSISAPEQAINIFPSALPLLELEGPDFPVKPGQATASAAKAVIASIAKAVALTQEGTASAVVTNPIHKATLYDAGFDHPGHTEFLAHLAGLPPSQSVMMLIGGGLRVIPLTVHIPLKDVPSHIDADRLHRVVHIVHDALKERFAITKPRIAIAGLNPHAGEGGTIGTEEETLICPAVQKLQQDGLAVTGPHAADTLFHEEMRTQYDVAICMYHDQALIPLKTLDFYGGVNVTLGLPFIRTSPDHGTALDIAGKKKARADSLIAALKTAADLYDRSSGIRPCV